MYFSVVLSFLKYMYTKVMKKYLLFLALSVLLPAFSMAFSGSEVQITKDGTAVMNGVKVMQQAGTTFYTRLYWGDSFVRVLVKTNSKTIFYRATGELTKINEISDGNLLDIVGELESGTSGLTLIAKSIKNSSVQKEQSTFSGVVTSIDLTLRKFVINTKTAGIITIQTGTTTVFTKGSRTLDLEHVRVGDTITKTSGDYDLTTKILQATNVVTFVDPNYYKPRLFEGKLIEISGVNVPTSIKVNVSGVDYLINVSEKTLVLNKIRNTVMLGRFVVGDSIRIFGTLREVDELIIDAEVVRNTNI